MRASSHGKFLFFELLRALGSSYRFGALHTALSRLRQLGTGRSNRPPALKVEDRGKFESGRSSATVLLQMGQILHFFSRKLQVARVSRFPVLFFAAKLLFLESNLNLAPQKLKKKYPYRMTCVEISMNNKLILLPLSVRIFASSFPQAN